MLITEDVAERLVPKFANKAEDLHVHIMEISNGTIEQLKELVAVVAKAEVSVI